MNRVSLGCGLEGHLVGCREADFGANVVSNCISSSDGSLLQQSQQLNGPHFFPIERRRQHSVPLSQVAVRAGGDVSLGSGMWKMSCVWQAG